MNKLTNRDITYDFLKRYGINVDFFSKFQFIEHFVKDSQQSLHKENYLPNIPSYVKMSRDSEKKVLVIDAGGTNLRVALVQNHKIIYFQKYKMPGSDVAITKNIFFDRLTNYILPIIEEIKEIKFCFSYATKTLPDGDAEVISMAKEIKIEGIEGTLLGESINNELKRKGVSEKKEIIILNDTVATLLAGKFHHTKPYDSYVGVILGTGFNIAYIEQGENIKKIKCAPNTEQIINMEAGFYNNHIEQSIFDQMLDKKSNNPSQFLIEKMISGAYLGSICLEVFKQAGEEDIFNEHTAKVFEKIDFLSTQTVNDYLINHTQSPLYKEYKITDKDDLEKMYFIINHIIERAVVISTSIVASVLIKIDKGKSPLNPICINVDGSTFKKLKRFRSKFYSQLKDIVNPLGIYFDLVEMDNSPILGASLAEII